MEEFLYLEADEEITSVIDKLKGLESKSVGLVAPKGSMIAQSLVSLKLLQKEANKQSKQIAIVTSDEVGRNLAAQVGLDVYADVKSTKPLDISSDPGSLSKEPIEIDIRDEGKGEPRKSKSEGVKETSQTEPVEEEKLPKDFTIHRYDEKEDVEDINAATQEIEAEEESIEPEKSETVASVVPEHIGKSENEFVKRPVGDLKDYSKRQEIEDSRPIRYQDIKQEKTRDRKVIKAKPYVLGILGIIVLASLVLLADLLFAKLTVNLKVEADSIDKTVEVKVEKDRPKSDLDAGIIPGIQVVKEKDVEASIDSTGEKDLGEKAKGIIAFKNESGTDEKILAGSSVRSSSSVEFTLDSEVTVPKASLNSDGDKVLGQASGAITAKEPGTQGNMAASTTYAVVGKSKISASGATTGGVTRKVKIVTKSDIERGKRELQNKNSDALIEEAKSDKTKVFLDDAGSIELSDYQASKNVNDEADKFVAKGKLRYTTLVFSSDDLKEASIKQVEKTLDQEKGLVTTDSDKISPSIKENQINIGALLLNSQVLSHVGPKIDMKQQAMSWRMKPIKKIKEIAGAIQGVELGSIDLSPQWALPVAPIINKNIKINVEYSPKTDSSN